MRRNTPAPFCAFLLIFSALTISACATARDDTALQSGGSLYHDRSSDGVFGGAKDRLRFFLASDTQSFLHRLLPEHDSRSTSPDAVLAFYKGRNFEPAWSGSAVDMAREARIVLSRAHEQGLIDSDYPLPEAARLKPGEAAALYEIEFTASVLRYIHDVKLGRVRPQEIYEDADLPAASFDVAAELGRALRQRRLTPFLGLAPPHEEYRQLGNALARYRRIAAQGGWPTIPGPAPKSGIKLDGKDKRLAMLIKRLSAEDPKIASLKNPSTEQLREAVKRFQGRNGLAVDGQVGAPTLAALNVPVAQRIEQIEANMERWRWLPNAFERRYVVVNVPDQSVTFVKDGDAILNSRAVIGRKALGTPIVRAEIQAAVVNPPWNIPGFIAARDLLPRLQKNANYLATKHMVVMDGPKGDPSGRTINWKTIKAETFPYAIRQLPGPQTALGALMLDSPNDFDVYLHDTPNKGLFKLTDREISNGCVRVQQIFPLASLALTGDTDAGMAKLKAALDTHQTQRIALPEPLPVYFLYWTAMPGVNGGVEFRPDLYARDEKLIAAMNHKALPKPLLPAKDGGLIATDDLSP